MRTGWLLVSLCVSTAFSAEEGVLFSASFDHWLAADVAAGGRSPVKRIGCALKPGKFGQALALDGRSYLEFPAKGNVGKLA